MQDLLTKVNFSDDFLSMVFWDVMLCIQVNSYQCFQRKYRFYPEVRETIQFSEMLVTVYKTT
jgi:Asp-tRNA(Asn)/Glu-tRNA(Gln) amidotransferase B subunit